MKKSILTAFAAMLALAASADRCSAAIEAYANINLSNFGVYNWDGASNSTAGGLLTNGSGGLTVISASFTSGAQGDIFSIAGGPVATAAGGVTPAGLDTLQAYEGVGVAPPQNTFTNVPAPPAAVPFARGDTTGAGAIIAGLGFSTPASASAVSEAQLPTGVGPFDIGAATSSVTSTAAFNISVAGSLSALFDLDMSRFLVADLTPGPPGISASAVTSFNIAITPAGSTTPIFSWSPNGGTGGITGGIEFDDDFNANTGTSGFPNTISSISNASGNFNAGVTLGPGNYSVTIQTRTQADVTRAEIVPEPVSVATWTVLAGMGAAFLAKSHRKA